MKAYAFSTSAFAAILCTATSLCSAFSPTKRRAIKPSPKRTFCHETPSSNTYPLHTDSIQLSALYYKKNYDNEDRAVNEEEIDRVVVEKETLVSKKQSRVVRRSSPLKNIVQIETMDDFVDHMYSNQDKVVIVRFFASWCRVSRNKELFDSFSIIV